LVGVSGLDVAHAPDSTLVECRVSLNDIYIHKPGRVVGGTILDVYGVKFGTGTNTVTVILLV